MKRLGFIILAGISTQAGAEQAMPSSLSCIQSLCGDQNPFHHPFELSKEIQAQTYQRIDAELKRPLEKYMGRIIHKSLLLDQAFKALIKRDLKFTLSPEHKALVSSIRYFKKLDQLTTAIEFTREGELTFNRLILRDLLGDPTDDEINGILSLRHVYANQKTFVNLAQKTSYELLLKLRNPGLAVLEAQKIESKKILETQNHLNDLLPALKYVQPDNLIINKAAKGDVLTEAEQSSLVDRINQNIVMAGLLDFEIQAVFKKVYLDVDQFLAVEKAHYLASENGKALNTPQTVKTVFVESVLACKDKLAYSYAALPTQGQLTTFKKMYQIIEMKSQQLMEEKTKSSLVDGFKLEVFYPQAKEDSLRDWKETLVSATVETEGAISKLKTLDLSDPETAESLVVIFAAFRNEKMFGDVLDFCTKAKPPYLSDAASYRRRAVNLSWPTITHPETGLGILAHELGHIASAKWGQYFINESDCLMAKQKTGLYAEEDFADLFAGQVIKGLAGQVNGVLLKNPACSTIKRGYSGWVAEGLKNSDPKDSHSSGLYRTLVLAQITSKISPQCVEYLEAVKDQRFSPYCVWEKDLKYPVYQD